MKKIFIIICIFFIQISGYSQDIKISFAGSGLKSTVSSVIVENKTQGKTITLLGSEILHLVGTITGINSLNTKANNFKVYPNPSSDKFNIEFTVPSRGETYFELSDISGKLILQGKNNLQPGSYIYEITGLKNGVYLVRIFNKIFSYNEKLVSNSNLKFEQPQLHFFGNTTNKSEQTILKNATIEKVMQYNTGDKLKFTGISDPYSQVIIDTPEQSKTVTFDFKGCEDDDSLWGVYTIIKIGNQVWFADNLRAERYRNGDGIYLEEKDNNWKSTTFGSFCKFRYQDVYNDNKITYFDPIPYGYLYNSLAVKDSRNIAPPGWHVSTIQEWNDLINYAGGENVAGGKLKRYGTKYWESPNAGASDTYDFNGFPGGRRFSDGTYSWMPFQEASWWSIDSNGNFKSWVVSYNYSVIEGFEGSGNIGCSVRCVKDDLIKTNSISSITSNSATCSGELSSFWGNAVSEKGICYSTATNPTINNNKIIASNGTGQFNCTIINLIPNTMYYLRTYAKNEGTVEYGKELTFRTYTQGSEIVKDIDGNVYHTVKIGDQVWLVENLKTTRYNDGSIITNITNKDTWANLTTPAYCWYNNDINNRNTKGALYNWYAVNTGKLCPKGWHIPSNAEWATLIGNIGGMDNAGGKLKEIGIFQWLSPNTGATNETGFTALPGNYRGTYGDYSKDGYLCYWWSTNEDPNHSSGASYWGVYYDNAKVASDYYYKNVGFSVRCIKD